MSNFLMLIPDKIRPMMTDTDESRSECFNYGRVSAYSVRLNRSSDTEVMTPNSSGESEE